MDSTNVSWNPELEASSRNSAEAAMRAIYADKKANSGVKNRIKKMLDIADEEEK